MYRILLITADSASRKELKSGLLEKGISVSAADMKDLLKEDFHPPKADIVLLDLEKSVSQTHKICHTLKRDPLLKGLPLIALIPESSLQDMDFSWGIDDYLSLPVSARRVSERIKFLMWQRNKVDLKNGLRCGELAIDFERYEVHLKGEPVDLTYKEFELLKFLATQPGRVFSREALLDKVWGYDFYGGTRTVDVHIRRLRSKIETGRQVYVHTIRNVGYKFLNKPG